MSKPIIGRNYHGPGWSWSRASDGTFSWFRYEMDSDELALQRALIGDGPATRKLTRLVAGALTVMALIALAVSCHPLPV